MRSFFIIALALLLCGNAYSQLTTFPLGSMDFSDKQTNRPVRASRTVNLPIPFIEDFSHRGPKPDDSLWLDQDVFINAEFPLNPPSIGVATFDGLDARGIPYSKSNTQGPADTLTSNPIDLNYPPSDSVYLSFFYQPSGLGNFPEYVDTFQLEFKNPDDTLWTWIWSSKGEDYPQNYRDFTQVMIPITDTLFLKDGFQFRFRNYAQLNGSWDHWHLDYIRLDKNRNRNDTLFSDVGLMYPSHSLLKDYQIVPYKHFLPQANENMALTYSLSFFNQTATNTNRFYGYVFRDINLARVDFLEMEAHGPLLPRAEYILTDPVKYTYEDRGGDSTVYYLKHFIDANTDAIRRNDTSEYIQVLSNYYALDDGTAEERIGLNNNQTGFVAQRFETYLADTLKAVQFYFNRVADGIIDKPYTLMVWRAGSNVPGELIAYQEEVYPTDSMAFNKFHTVALNTPVYLPAGTYYFGWAQAVAFPLNLGFDRNMQHSDRIFYNLDGTWYNYSSEQGTMMIRPVFRKPYAVQVGTSELETKASDWKLYPNPSDGATQLQLPGISGKSVITLADVTGRILQQQVISGESCTIETTSLSDGMYVITVADLLTRRQTSKRLIVQH